MKALIGKVISTKMLKTVVVEVETSRPHPLYKKIVKKRKKFKAHNENLRLKMGDKVCIVQTRPISKGKNFKVIKVEGVLPPSTPSIKKGKGVGGKL